MNKSNKNKKRSRSRSRDRKNNKKDKIKRKSSYSSSSSNSDSLDSNFERKLNKMRNKTKFNKKERKTSPVEIKRRIVLPNKGILANIIQDNLRNNKKLDYDEVERATQQLKKVDTESNKKSILMSSYINTSIVSPESQLQNNNGEYIKIPKIYECHIDNCNTKFAYLEELREHLKNHN